MPSPYCNRAIAIATQEWQRFGGQVRALNGHLAPEGHEETEEPFSTTINKYWRAVDPASLLTGKDVNVPWSAAFISYVMTQADQGTPKAFRVARAHRTYIRWAINNRLNSVPGARFIGWPLSLRVIEPGDIIGKFRENDDDSIDGMTYDEAALTTKSYGAHCDLVVAVNGQVADVIGGNVSDSVTKTQLRLNPDGTLPGSPTSWFVAIESLL